MIAMLSGLHALHTLYDLHAAFLLASLEWLASCVGVHIKLWLIMFSYTPEKQSGSDHQHESYK